MNNILNIIILIFAAGTGAIFHEVAHGYTAYLLGDNTAKNAGRLTLNPLRHISLYTTIIMPIVLIILKIPPIILFKPVPINVNNLRNPRRDSRLVALAGPFANFILVLIMALFFRLFLKNMNSQLLFTFVYYFIIINLLLGSFNLIPIPPLDGSWILASFLPEKQLQLFNQVKTYLLIIFLFLIFSGGFNYIWTPIIKILNGITKVILFA